MDIGHLLFAWNAGPLTAAEQRLGAERAAQLDAFRNLLAQVKGIQIQSGKTVGDEMAAKDEIRGKVEGLVRGFKITNKRYFSDSGVEIDVEVPLAALTEALLPSGKTELALKTDGEIRVRAANSRGMRSVRSSYTSTALAGCPSRPARPISW